MNGCPLWERFAEQAAAREWTRLGVKLLVGVSGGPDSMALLDLLARLRAAGGPELHIYHLHHRLRGAEASKDATFVRAAASRYGCPCTVVTFDVARFARRTRASLEEAGRRIRHHFLRRVARRFRCRWGAMAHTADDQVETFFLNLFRGAGPAGLSGMAPERDEFLIRPLLPFSREEVLAYCRARAIPYRNDSSNASPWFLRNRIRRDLLPSLEADFAPMLRRQVLRTMEILRDEDEWMEMATDHTFARLAIKEPDGVRLPVEGFAEIPVALQRRMVRRAVREVLGTLEGMEFRHIEELRRLPEKRPGARYELEGRLLGEFAHGCLSIWVPQEGGGSRPSRVVPIPGICDLAPWGCRMETVILHPAADGGMPGKGIRVRIDYERLGAPLVVRSRRPGDRIRLPGVGGRQKISDLLINRKVPRARRDRIPLVEAGGRIVLVGGIVPPAVAEDVLVTRETREVLEIAMTCYREGRDDARTP